MKNTYSNLKRPGLLVAIIIAPFLIALFILIYLNGKHEIIKLPVIKEQPKITFSDLLKPENSQYSGFVTLVSFFDHSLEKNEVLLFNLHELILKENSYPDFQLLVFVRDSSQLAPLTKKMKKWDKSSHSNWAIHQMDILTMYENMISLSNAEQALYHPDQAFIIDKDLNQRRRAITEGQTPKSGYEVSSIAVLKKELSDDVRITVAEYRLALKENDKHTIGNQ